jgi:SAM-dependent methyltransferase
MREKLRLKCPKIRILEGIAENIPMPDASVDVVFVAQAFHWFSGEGALREIHRILKPSGRIGLIWNSRDESLDWVAKLTDLIDIHEQGAPRYKYGTWKKAWQSSQQFSPFEETHFRYNHIGSREMVIDRVASISFIAALEPQKLKNVLSSVRSLLDQHPMTKDTEELTLPYRTDVFLATKLN